MSVSRTPVTTYDDGFPKAHPSLPPSTRRSGRRGVHRRPLVDRRSRPNSSQRVVGACRRKVGGTQSLQAAHENLATRVVDPTLSTAERAGGAGGGLGNPSSFVVTRAPATHPRGGGPPAPRGSPPPPPPPPPRGHAPQGGPPCRTRPRVS